MILVIGAVVLAVSGTDIPGKNPNDLTLQIDHFVMGISELEKGVEQFNRLTGVKPVPGGKHPFMGTHNALVSLGDKLYLEILAPQPGMDMGLYSKMSKLTPLTWAVSTNNIRGLKEKLRKQGFETTELIPGFRTTPEGSKLEWSALMVIKPAIKEVPFFTQWKGRSVHPSETSPQGCRLHSFELSTPNADMLKRLLADLELSIKVYKSPSSVVTFVLNSPRGKVEF